MFAQEIKMLKDLIEANRTDRERLIMSENFSGAMYSDLVNELYDLEKELAFYQPKN